VLLQPGEVGPRGLPVSPPPVAASVGRPEPHSGFDVARGGPRATRQLAPAGSVYFFDVSPSGPTLAASAEARAVGEATFITAAWKE
jgi:CRISPR-associated protein Cmr3